MSSRLASIVIPTHNRCELLLRTLGDVDAIDIPEGVECEVIVVANACRDDTVARVAMHAAGARLPTSCISVPTPGLNPARNVGLEHARGTHVLFLDDDIRVEKTLLTAMMRAFDEHAADLVGGRVTLLWEAVQRPEWLADDLLWVLSNAELGDEVRDSPDGRGLIGACFGFRREVAEAIGGFRIGLDRAGDRLLGGGESDFIQRAIRHGFRACHVPAMHVHHWVAPHRATPEYVLGVSRGYGESRIYIKPSFGPVVAARALLGHAWLVGYHTMAGAVAADPAVALRHRARAATGAGGLRGSLLRCLGRAPR